MATLPISLNFLFRRVDDDERERREMAKRDAAERKRLQKEQQREAKYFSKALPVWLANLGFAWWYRKSEKDLTTGSYKPVRFDKIQIGEDAYYYRIDTRHLPRGVFIHNLSDQQTLDSLSASANSEVTYFRNETGSWFSVATTYNKGRIPINVGYSEMRNKITADAPPLVFPLGMGENQKPYFGDLDKMINCLIGGTKGGGKSNIANVMLCTLIGRNEPHNLRIFLTDLKGGMEFADYSGIPHLGGDVLWRHKAAPVKNESTGEVKKQTKVVTFARDYVPGPDEQLNPPPGQAICTEPGQVIPVLRYVEAELERRANLLAGKAKKIATYNNRYPDKKLSYWLVVIDELATLMENKQYKGAARDSMAEIARKGRAVGIYIVLATQTPTSDIIPQQIGNNMDSRLAFRTGSGVASGILLGSGEYDAEKLPAVPGRFIWKLGGEKIEIQSPFIEDATVKGAIADARAGVFSDPTEVELRQKANHLFEFSLRNFGGECHINNLHKSLKPDGYSRNNIMAILDRFEGKEITMGDVVYRLAPAQEGKKVSRWLVVSAEWGKVHPHPDFNWKLLEGRFQMPDSTQNGNAITGEIQNPETPSGEIAHSPIDILAELPFLTVGQLPNGPPTDIEIADSDIELSTWDAFDDDATEPLPDWLK